MALSQCFILGTKRTIIKRTSTIPPAVPGFLGGTLGHLSVLKRSSNYGRICCGLRSVTTEGFLQTGLRMSNGYIQPNKYT